jgi:hypothetical protein
LLHELPVLRAFNGTGRPATHKFIPQFSRKDNDIFTITCGELRGLYSRHFIPEVCFNPPREASRITRVHCVKKEEDFFKKAMNKFNARKVQIVRNYFKKSLLGSDFYVYIYS